MDEAMVFERLAEFKRLDPPHPLAAEYQRNFCGHSWWSSADIAPVSGIFLLKGYPNPVTGIFVSTGAPRK